MRTKPKPIPDHLRHRVVCGSNGRWRLETWYGYVLKDAETREEIDAYFARHCPAD